MNNTRDAARNIYGDYMKRIAGVSVDQSLDLSRIGVLGVYWPSTLQLTEPKITPSRAVLAGDGITERLQGILSRNSSLRLHLTAHSLGTIVLASTLGRLIQAGLGHRIGSVFLIQGAVQSGWFNPGAPLANAQNQIAGPIIATHSHQDLLMLGAHTAMSAESETRGSIAALKGVLKALETFTPFKPRESFPKETWWLDQGYDSFRTYLGGINFSTPAAIHGLAGGQPVVLHRSLDDTAECGSKQYPYNGGQKGLYSLNCNHAICGHDEYKIRDVAFAHLVATGLLVSPPSSRQAWPFSTNTPTPETWMGDLWSTIRQRPLNRLVMPGAHDAGSSVTTATYPAHRKDAILTAFVRHYVTSNTVGKVADAVLTEGKKAVQLVAGLFRSKSPPIDRRSALETDGAQLAASLVNPMLPLLINRTQALSTTQSKTIADQLNAGVRYFDIRPVIHGGRFYLAHIDYQEIIKSNTLGAASYIGAVGENMEVVLRNVAAFASAARHKHELIVLTFSHFHDLDSQAGCSVAQIQPILDLVKGILGNHLILGSSADSRLDEMTLEQLVGEGRTVLCAFDERGLPSSLPLSAPNGLHRWGTDDSIQGHPVNLKVYDSYANSPKINDVAFDQLGKFQRFPISGRRGLFLLSWTITTNNADPLTLAFGDVRGGAIGINRALLPTIHDWITTGDITADKVPNIIYHDFVGDDAPAAPTGLMAVIQRLNSLS